MFRTTLPWRCGAVFATTVALASGATAQDAATQHAAAREFSAAQQRGVDFLLAHAKDGTFLQKDEPHVGLTALGLAAVLTKPADTRSDAERAFVKQCEAFLLAQQNDDGSFGTSLQNYQTSAVTLALVRLDDEAARAALRKARDFLVFAQNVDAAGFAQDDQNYGSFGYGPGNRGDLSNTQFAIEALHRSGLPADHDAFAKAIVFLQRTQNLRSVNDFKTRVTERGSDESFAVEPGDDGGAGYYPGNSKFGYDVVADGVHVPRSYGSMTYALLKTYTFCGLGADDPRVQAATDWIRRNWTLDVNPGAHAGMGDDAPYQGLFYYYETMAHALDTCGIDELETRGEEPAKVDWRAALRAHLEAGQREDGSWLNDKNGRWWEDQPVVCTIYALLALAECPPRGAAK